MTGGPSNPIQYKQLHPSLQFIILIGLLIFALFAGSIFGAAIIKFLYGDDTLTNVFLGNLTGSHVRSALWILQFWGTTLPIIAAPVFFSYVIVHEPDNYLKTNFNFSWLFIVLVLAIIMASNPIMEFLGNINEKMVLPRSLNGLQQWMRQSEDDTKKLSDMMMQMGTIWNMIFDLLFIGLLTAIVEETLFRGCLQTILIKWFKNKHVAIWVGAILFSAFHMEFFGFLPRLMLGVLFGYFAAWSGSVWPGIWGHFVNNG
ncbi:MAG: CPBP family intramembrane glutamic endopeptidase, partial [Mucilaginibacter sp.]